MNADAAWDALNKALEDVKPPCTGQALFVADSRTDEQRATCSSICTRCPVADLCGAYASAAKVTAGFWAGVQYPPSKNKNTDAGAVIPQQPTIERKHHE